MREADLYQPRTWKVSTQRILQAMLFPVLVLPALLINGLFFGQPAYAGNKIVVIPLGGDEPATSKLLFISNGSWKGKLGGVQGADDKCDAEAKSRGIKGRFEALLGTGTNSPEVRSNRYSLPYVRLDGSTLRSSYQSLFQGLDNAISQSSIPEVV